VGSKYLVWEICEKSVLHRVVVGAARGISDDEEHHYWLNGIYWGEDRVKLAQIYLL
jgi:hypothetical protein